MSIHIVYIVLQTQWTVTLSNTSQKWVWVCQSTALTKFVQASLLIYRPQLSGLTGARGLSCSVYTGSKSTSCRVGDLRPMEKAPLDAAVE